MWMDAQIGCTLPRRGSLLLSLAVDSTNWPGSVLQADYWLREGDARDEIYVNQI